MSKEFAARTPRARTQTQSLTPAKVPKLATLSQSNGFLFSWRSSEGDVQTVLPDWATFWGRSAVLPDWATFWGRSAVLPDWATFWGRSAVLPDWATFWGRSAVLPDWATFWGRSDSVARLGYLLRTFRQCCQIGLPFEDVQTVLPDWATFWGLQTVLPDWATTFSGLQTSVARLGYYFWGLYRQFQIGLLFTTFSFYYFSCFYFSY